MFSSIRYYPKQIKMERYDIFKKIAKGFLNISEVSEIMKMLLVIYPCYSDERITNAFKQSGYTSYTKTHNATGVGVASEPKLGTHYSPGKNNMLLFAVHDEEVPHIVKVVRRLKAEHPRSGLRAFTFPLEECP